MYVRKLLILTIIKFFLSSFVCFALLELFTASWNDFLYQEYIEKQELYASIGTETIFTLSKEEVAKEATSTLNEWYTTTKKSYHARRILTMLAISEMPDTFQEFTQKIKAYLQDSRKSPIEKNTLQTEVVRYIGEMIRKNHTYASDRDSIYLLLSSDKKGNCQSRNNLYAAILNACGIEAYSANISAEEMRRIYRENNWSLANSNEGHQIAVVKLLRYNRITACYEERYVTIEIGTLQNKQNYSLLALPSPNGYILAKIEDPRRTPLEPETYALPVTTVISDPDNVTLRSELLFNSACKYTDNHALEQALKKYNQAIELNPSYANAYCNRGLLYMKKGDYDRAIEDFNKAIELNPSDAMAYCSRGHVYFDQGDYDRAIEDFNKAIELNPSDADVYKIRGNVYFDQGDYDRAIEDFNKAIEYGASWTVWLEKIAIVIVSIIWPKEKASKEKTDLEAQIVRTDNMRGEISFDQFHYF